ncbi:hypothetical protein [Sphingobacterium siyangense]|uniref:hypothetical protein n=1 Tax=Sphingobacterium siyangense TaxID=459529 RepID=UPI00289775F1|nr:hypothetical protein [Sphingobacterium siyangense]
MTLEELINHHRNTYINQLISFYENRGNGVKEILLKLSADEETLLFNLTRPDFLSNNDGNYGIEELYPDTFSNHQPINFVYKNLSIELHPIFWHGVEFIFDTKFAEFEWLKSWTTTALKENNDESTNELDLLEAIHNVSIPSISEKSTIFTVDFGTSTSETFFALLDTINETGAKNIIINSFDLIEE